MPGVEARVAQVMAVARSEVDSIAIPLIATAEFSEQSPTLSPNGRWLAYTIPTPGIRRSVRAGMGLGVKRVASPPPKKPKGPVENEPYHTQEEEEQETLFHGGDDS